MKCILPWINFGTNTYGRPRVCGYSDHDAQWKKLFNDRGYPYPPPPANETPEHILKSDFAIDWKSWLEKLENSNIEDQWNGIYFRDIRKTFLENKWPENCKRCKHVESLGGTSKRMDENHMWYEKYEHLIDSTKDDGNVPYQPQHIDVRTGTVCNFKCIHCSPASSSRWTEDESLIIKYGYKAVENDDKWIAQDTKFWDNLDISQIKRYNFLGGESFYNKRHNEFIKKLNKSPYAKDVEIAYVSNGSLKFKNMENFKKVRLRLSVDCAERAGEYFRFGLNWKQWTENIKEFPPNFDVSFQWTCSNISMFYLVGTYDILREEFPNIRFLFNNHVTEPYHMSVQNLPNKLKDKIKREVDAYMFEEDAREVLPFYINHMFEKDSWNSHGKILINYLNDLDNARNIDWRTSFSEMSLEKYVGQ